MGFSFMPLCGNREAFFMSEEKKLWEYADRQEIEEGLEELVSNGLGSVWDKFHRSVYEASTDLLKKLFMLNQYAGRFMPLAQYFGERDRLEAKLTQDEWAFRICYAGIVQAKIEYYRRMKKYYPNAERPMDSLRKIKMKDVNYGKFIAWIPHSGMYLPGIYGREQQYSALIRDAKTLCDEGADQFVSFLPNKITSGYSRFAVDLERYEDDSKEPMSAKGMGMLYEKLIDGSVFDRKPFGDSSFFRQYYRHKHGQLKEMIEQAGDGCVLIDMHSFCGNPLKCDFDQNPDRPDICLGFNDDETKPSDEKIAEIRDIFEKHGLDVALNRPFKGSMTVKTNVRYTSLMIEVNKSVYIDKYGLNHWVHILEGLIKEAVRVLS